MLSASHATPIYIEGLSTSELLMEVAFIFDSYPPSSVNPEHRTSRNTSTKEFSEPGSNLQPGTNINDQFKILSALGEGGMSFVYLCDDLILNVEPDVVQKFHKLKPDCRLIQ